MGLVKKGADLNVRNVFGHYVTHECNETSGRCRIIKYVQRLKFLGYRVEGNRFENFGEYLSEIYGQELKEMNIRTIAWSPGTTLYDVLFMERHSLL